MNEKEILTMLNEMGAVITESHLVYTSGKHGSAYVNKDAIYPHTKKIQNLGHQLALRFIDDNVEVVLAPAIGGVILSQWVAYALTIDSRCRRDVLAVYAEKETFFTPFPFGNASDDPGEERFVIKRGYDKLVKDKRILVVEDILNTGGSAKKVVDAVRKIGGNVIGLGAICNRGNITAEDVGDVPKLVSLVNVKLDAWDEHDCPLCKEKVPINTDVGKGREFLARTKH